jgi:hypothetical protein
MRCTPSAIIRPSQQRVETRYRNGDTADIMAVILEADAQAGSFVDAQGVECLVGYSDYDTARNVWNFVKRSIRYRADRSGLERVQSPGALFASRAGDCKSLSIASAAILRALGFRNIRYRFTAYAPGNFSHVYVVARIGGRDVILDTVHSRFDEEVAYRKKKDIAAARVSGIRGHAVRGDISATLGLLGLGLVAYIFYSLND